MKKILVIVLPAIIYGCSGPTATNSLSQARYGQLDSLLKSKDYFAARDTFIIHGDELSDFHRLIVEADLDNAFNRLAASNRRIDSLFQLYKGQLPDTLQYQLLHTRQMNHAKLFEYRQANDAMQAMVNNYRRQMTDEELKDNQNTRKIWAALAGQPAQEVTIKDNTVLLLKRDKLGLQNLVLTLDTLDMDFIFDTGANFSTVTETTAKKLHMKMMDTTTIDVGSITGKDVEAKMAVCPVFTLGNIIVKNAVFLVFPDEALAIPQAHFQINGIIGFPVIEAMKEVQLTKDGKFIVPLKQTSYHEQNMALNFPTPVILLDGANYTFDSGANSTTLYDHYFNKYKDKIESGYTETDITIGGAGGNITKKGYFVTFETKINDKMIRLDSVQLFKETLKDNNHFAGNIGQDLIGQFSKLTINFDSMFIRFD